MWHGQPWMLLPLSCGAGVPARTARWALHASRAKALLRPPETWSALRLRRERVRKRSRHA
eukprot:5512889-Prymnesium_polylepis.4